jgi:hypothetical protein
VGGTLTEFAVLVCLCIYLPDDDLVEVETCGTLTEFAVLVCLCIHLPDDDLVEVETCRKDTSQMIIYY